MEQSPKLGALNDSAFDEGAIQPFDFEAADANRMESVDAGKQCVYQYAAECLDLKTSATEERDEPFSRNSGESQPRPQQQHRLSADDSPGDSGQKAPSGARRKKSLAVKRRQSAFGVPEDVEGFDEDDFFQLPEDDEEEEDEEWLIDDDGDGEPVEPQSWAQLTHRLERIDLHESMPLE